MVLGLGMGEMGKFSHYILAFGLGWVSILGFWESCLKVESLREIVASLA